MKNRVCQYQIASTYMHTLPIWILPVCMDNIYNKTVKLLGKSLSIMEKQKILIIDDSEMNRALLADIPEEQYDASAKTD